MSEHELLTIEEVAKMLRVSERTVYNWAQKGEIPCGKFGTTWRFKRSDVTRWIDQRVNMTSRKPLPGDLVLTSVLDKSRVVFLDGLNKDGVLRRLVDILSTDGRVHDKDALLDAIFRREELMSTGIGVGVGVPHVRIDSVDDIIMAVGVCRTPIEDYESLDNEPVQIVCMIAARSDQHAQHIKLLSAVSKLLKDAAIREQILACETIEAVFEIFTGEANA
jgi:PTS system nitrogen regulatory IIA component